MTTNKVCGKGKCKFTDEFCASGDCPYDTDNVAQANSQDLERVADTSKTIDHIADVSKKVSLTEQWKKGELKTGWYYVSRNNNVEMLEYVGDYFLSVDVPLIDDKDVSTLEVLAPVPSYDEWRSLQSSWVDEMDRATRFKKALDDVCEEYNSKLPILEAENQRLKK